MTEQVLNHNMRTKKNLPSCYSSGSDSDESGSRLESEHSDEDDDWGDDAQVPVRGVVSVTQREILLRTVFWRKQLMKQLRKQTKKTLRAQAMSAKREVKTKKLRAFQRSLLVERTQFLCVRSTCKFINQYDMEAGTKPH